MNEIKYTRTDISFDVNVKSKSGVKIKSVFNPSSNYNMLCFYSKYVPLMPINLNKLYSSSGVELDNHIANHLKKYENIILSSADTSIQSNFNIVGDLNLPNINKVFLSDTFSGLLKVLVMKYAVISKFDAEINVLRPDVNENTKIGKKYIDEVSMIYGYKVNLINNMDYKYANVHDNNASSKLVKEFDNNKQDLFIYRYLHRNVYILRTSEFFNNVILIPQILKIGGTAIVAISRIMRFNKVIKQLICILSSLFKETIFVYTPTILMTDCYYRFNDFIGIDSSTLSKFKDAQEQINKINPDGGINFNVKDQFDRKKYGITAEYTTNSYNDIIYSIFDINNKSSKFRKFMIAVEDVINAENKLNRYAKKIFYEKLIYQDKENIFKYIDNNVSNNISFSIEYCKKFEIVINPVYTKSKEDQEKKILDNTITLPRNLIMNLLDYEQLSNRRYSYVVNNEEKTTTHNSLHFNKNTYISKKIDFKNLLYDDKHIYDIPGFKDLLKELNLYKISIDSRKGYNRDGNPVKSMEDAMDDYRSVTMFINVPQGVTYYVKNNYGINVTRAFVKMYEILNEFNLINFQRNEINTFHTCELPGHFINATNYFIKSNKPNMIFNWNGNSLNPNNEANKIKYNQEIFGDSYGFLSKYKDRWLWGKDNTGDITTVDNIKYFKDKFQFSIDLFTSDCGLACSDVESFSNREEDLAMLNFCQCFISLQTLKIGGHGVYKLFLPMGSSLNISIIYLMTKYFEYIYFIKQFASSYGSSEIYMICKNKKKNLEPEMEEYLYKCLLTFDKKKALFPKDVYEPEFLTQMMHISKHFVKRNISAIKRSLYYYDNKDILLKHKPLIETAKKIYGKIWCSNNKFVKIDQKLNL